MQREITVFLVWQKFASRSSHFSLIFHNLVQVPVLTGLLDSPSSANAGSSWESGVFSNPPLSLCLLAQPRAFPEKGRLWFHRDWSESSAEETRSIFCLGTSLGERLGFGGEHVGLLKSMFASTTWKGGHLLGALHPGVDPHRCSLAHARLLMLGFLFPTLQFVPVFLGRVCLLIPSPFHPPQNYLPGKPSLKATVGVCRSIFPSSSSRTIGRASVRASQVTRASLPLLPSS